MKKPRTSTETYKFKVNDYGESSLDKKINSITSQRKVKDFDIERTEKVYSYGGTGFSGPNVASESYAILTLQILSLEKEMQHLYESNKNKKLNDDVKGQIKDMLESLDNKLKIKFKDNVIKMDHLDYKEIKGDIIIKLDNKGAMNGYFEHKNFNDNKMLSSLNNRLRGGRLSELPSIIKDRLENTKITSSLKDILDEEDINNMSEGELRELINGLLMNIDIIINKQKEIFTDYERQKFLENLGDYLSIVKEDGKKDRNNLNEKYSFYCKHLGIITKTYIKKSDKTIFIISGSFRKRKKKKSLTDKIKNIFRIN